ncbi:hypothetical protein LSTR_LSTR003398 [Laodelphax striatellus]|uniref:Uncharacterized protein n=1 Tax=Laodelphax striatellus TaxID=195883 RepID=A0A482X5W1_LAOST|nr:hypothetical protein LSTR_LSTR003398 [Laodelphax striatellus]
MVYTKNVLYERESVCVRERERERENWPQAAREWEKRNEQSHLISGSEINRQSGIHNAMAIIQLAGLEWPLAQIDGQCSVLWHRLTLRSLSLATGKDEETGTWLYSLKFPSNCTHSKALAKSSDRILFFIVWLLIGGEPLTGRFHLALLL